MKKIKGLLFAFVALFAFTLAMVKVNAANISFGVYEVTTTTNANDTAKWDYTGAQAQASEFAVNDDLMGIIVETKKVQGKAGFLSVYTNANTTPRGTILVPVPANSAGSLKITALEDQAARKLLLDSTGAIQNISCLGAGDTVNFDNDDIFTVAGKTYLRLKAFVTETQSSAREFKITKIEITLSSGSFEAAAETFDVNYFDGNTKLKSEKVTDGNTTTYKPAKWGYDVVGVYTQSDMQESSKVELPVTVTANTDLYVKFAPWAAGEINNNSNILDFKTIKKGYDTFGDAIPGTIALGTTFELLDGAVFGSANATVPGFDAKAPAGIKTGGALSVSNQSKGLLLNATAAGILSIYGKSGSTGRELRVCAVPESATSPADYIQANAPLADAAGLVTINIPAAGKYLIGAPNLSDADADKGGSVWFYHVQFSAPSITVYQQSAKDGDKELVRYIAVIENIPENQLAGNFTLKLTIEGLPAEYANGFDVTSQCVFAKAITSNGQPYSNNGYTFDAKENVIYAVCVVVVQNDGQNLTNQYDGKTLTATLSATGFNDMVKTYVVGSLN